MTVSETEKEILPCGHIFDCECEGHRSPQEESEDKPNEMSPREQDRYDEFNDLIGCCLKLDPKRYAQPWTDEMLLSMRALLTKSVKSFPKKSRPMLELFRKFLFDNGQLIAMAATAHAVAAQHAEKEESLIVKPSFSDLAKAELNKNE
jgi:hypothetical protein